MDTMNVKDYISIMNYKGKNIIHADYSKIGKDKKLVLELMKLVDREYEKAPPHSALALINVGNLTFDMEVLNKFKEAQNKYEKNQKKVALIGVSGILKAGYNFVIGITSNKTTKAFTSEEEAKEWLVSD